MATKCFGSVNPNMTESLEEPITDIEESDIKSQSDFFLVEEFKHHVVTYRMY